MSLPTAHDNLLLQWKADGLSGQKIYEKLMKEYNVQSSVSAISKRISKLKKDRAEAVGASVLIKLEGKVATDLDTLDGIIRRALEDELRSRQLAWNEDSKGNPINFADPEKQVGIKTLAGSEMWSRLMHVVRTSRSDLLHAIEKRLELAGAVEGKKPVTKEVRERLIGKLDQLLAQASQSILPKGPPDLKVVP
jgi:hypothetical protein